MIGGRGIAPKPTGEPGPWRQLTLATAIGRRDPGNLDNGSTEDRLGRITLKAKANIAAATPSLQAAWWWRIYDEAGRALVWSEPWLLRLQLQLLQPPASQTAKHYLALALTDDPATFTRYSSCGFYIDIAPGPDLLYGASQELGAQAGLVHAAGTVINRPNGQVVMTPVIGSAADGAGLGHGAQTQNLAMDVTKGVYVALCNGRGVSAITSEGLVKAHVYAQSILGPAGLRTWRP